MTDQDRTKWDARYEKDLGDFEPSAIVKRYWHIAPRRRALDIACGNGRNSLFLADHGFSVDAVDISTVATTHLMGRHPGIRVICQDLDAYTIAPQSI